MVLHTNNRTSDKSQVYITQDAEAYTDGVDNLMDDLFGEVETTLHVDQGKLRSQRQKTGQKTGQSQSTPYASAIASSSDIVAIAKVNSDTETAQSKDTVSISKLNMADITLPPISKEDVLWIQPYIMRNPEPTSQIPQNPPEPVAPKYNLFDRLLLVAACSSALIAAVMWTINHGIWIGKQSVNVAQILPEDNSKNKAFAQEIQQMLADITNKNRAIATGQSFTNTVGNNLPIVAAPMMANGLPMGNPVVGLQQAPMYVPVYQPPNLNNPNSPNLPSPLALPPANANNAVEIAAPNNAKSKAPVAAAVPAPAAPSLAYTLIGVLDLGDRSTAMLDMNGSVHSVGLGKAVGNSGWILSRVSQQEITLKRGKETKSVFVGQKF
ncbi:hypothetical protein H6F44_14295 [Pseudanabaena sp. FACHB-1277]|jgi:Tfp pilus assembly protein PilP|uniref:Type II secretion system protein GspC N-terminal domain-containing protein n=1 Tax=Pseudanabaena cinerea FACHB-1277 TaxID=2949581 RepID=A0A926UU54_9CYAN|nr:hypothetical protein [Pseudanabaena cinerea]MBD2151284.1 hypothetical protein [Pseudanabaena cinerea FACHB-1277]